MSTIDPSAAREDRRRRQAGSAGSLAGTVAAGALLTAAGAVAGYAVAAFCDRFRVMMVNSVFSDTESTMAVWVTPVAVIASLACFALYTRWNHRYSGSTAGFVGVGPAPLWLLGAAAALWWATTAAWAPADVVGTAHDPVFGRHEEWGLGAWIWYTMRWWLPGIVTLLLLSSVVAGVRARIRERGRRRTLVRLLAQGEPVAGEVTGVRGPAASNAGRVLLHWTFAFTDGQGRRRWVERAEVFPRDAVPVVGAPVLVLFDARNPGDTSRVFAAVRGGTAVADYLRTGMPVG